MKISTIRKFLTAQAPVILFLVAHFAGGQDSWIYAAVVAELTAIGVYFVPNTRSA